MTSAAVIRVAEPATSAGGRYPADAICPAGDEDTTVITLSEFLYRKTAVGPQSVLPMERTSSSPATRTHAPVGQTTSEAILELRRRSGLTWELLSEIFNVSRRTVHHWANGKPPSAQHEWEVRRTLDAVRHLDEGDRRATRDRLLTAANGLSLFDLLTERRYADVLDQTAGTASTNANRRHAALSEDEQAKRRPTPPVLLLDAITDRPNLPVGKARIVHPVRKKKPA